MPRRSAKGGGQAKANQTHRRKGLEAWNKICFKSIMFYKGYETGASKLRTGTALTATRQSAPSHSGETPRGQSDAQAPRIRSIGFLEASSGFKEASKKVQEAF